MALLIQSRAHRALCLKIYQGRHSDIIC
jgi:hypothetical protein